MNFETVKKKNSKKKIVVGVVVLLILTSVVMFVSTRAKYRSVQSIKLANGTVDYKAPDLKLAIKVSEDGVNYTSQSEIPTGNYTFNTEKSKCRIPTSTLNGENAPVDESVTIEYVDGKLNFRGLTHNDTKCYVYFDKFEPPITNVTELIASIESDLSRYKGETTPTFTSVATGAETEANNGIFKVADGMYGGSSYYWRGAATTNHVIFDSKCWRIVRINGDKSIRLIYNGTPTGNTCPGNGANSSSIVLSGTAYNSTYNNSKYVGWTYASSDIQRPSTANPQTSGTAAPIKTALESWYSSNISAAAKANVVKGKFCNDRNTKDGETWRATGDTQYYAAYQRLSSGTKTPTLSCPNGDVYSLDVGMITADEVQFAGASWTTTNKSYYLYNGQYYWTMSPYRWNGAYACVFIVRGDDGRLGNYNVISTYGLRPVINLSADTLFAVGGNGTSTNPYVVS